MVLNLLEARPRARSSFDGVDSRTLNSKEFFAFRRRVQPVFQDPYGSLDPMHNIGNTIEEPLRTHKVGDKASREKAGPRAARPGGAAAVRRCSGTRTSSPAASASVSPSRGPSRSSPNDRLRRGGFGARRAGAGAGAQPARRPAGRAGTDLPVHHARPRGGPPDRRPRLRHGEGQDRGAVHGRRLRQHRSRTTRRHCWTPSRAHA